ncbi:MAG: protein-tyrosine-phosphatase [Planctomycetota bacterium]
MKLRLYTSVMLVFSMNLLAPNASAELIEPVRPFVESVDQSLDSLPEERKEFLSGIVDYVVQKIRKGDSAKLNFICTHNSRRSHLAQVWFQTAAAYYNVPNVECFSGGTEATACNIRTIRALRRSGLSIVESKPGSNPIYLIQYAEKQPPVKTFSKVYSSEGNPEKGFAAMMCCSDADERCPLVSGADARFPLHYNDPKVSDNTPEEALTYDERCRQIAQEMFFVMSEVSDRIKGDQE